MPSGNLVHLAIHARNSGGRDPSKDRPATNPGGMECMRCSVTFIGEEWHHLCGVCYRESPTPEELDRKADLIERYCGGMLTRLKDQLLISEVVVSMRRQAADLRGDVQTLRRTS